MEQDELKQVCAEAALDHILPKLNPDSILGIGTGSTTNKFITLLANHKDKFQSAVASSEATQHLLDKNGITVSDLNDVNFLDLYIDGADEANSKLELIKGGGAALTQEKIVAAVSKKFICIIDNSKWVNELGAFPLPIEIIPSSLNFVTKEIKKMGGNPILRHGVITDNGNLIIDVEGLYPIKSPKKMEEQLNHITGVVTNGIFSLRAADIIFIASPDGVTQYKNSSTTCQQLS